MYKDDIIYTTWGVSIFGVLFTFILPSGIVQSGPWVIFASICLGVLTVNIFILIYYANSNTDYGPDKEGYRSFNVIDRVIWLERAVEGYLEDSSSGNFQYRHEPQPKYKKELDYLKEKYKDDLKGLKTIKKDKIKKDKTEKKAKAKAHSQRQYDSLYGSRNEHLVCPHCQSKGNVFKKTMENVEESREKGIIGATIGRKTITKKGNYDQLHCDKCGTTWVA